MELSEQTLEKLSKLIHRLCGLVIGPDKGYLVRHRLGPLVQSEGLESLEQLLLRLEGRGGSRLHDAIIEAITTKETSFFRDRAFFRALREVVLPERVEALKQSGDLRHRIRIWSAGCSTGQECYSVAMLIRELVAASGAAGPRENHFNILASDISTESIRIAKAGRYSRNEVARGLPAELLDRHFHRRGEHWIVDDALGRLVQFRRFDLLNSPVELGAFDVILCRNVLIYFDESARRRIYHGLYSVLQDGGWLALGAAESLFGAEHRFETVKVGPTILYRKPSRRG
ncbi:MAG TPA: protein-glutamate O-methyltransferase CheR [Phycisphaerae bacterium]|nr:protein-glutamate O-methyltransferase CheR [Phycisphaerae bacterium]